MGYEEKIITFGVLADTHIPDRAKALPKEIMDTFSMRSVDRILHAGDASSWKVVHALEKIAPVTIVQGNRDFLFGLLVPKHQSLTINGIKLILTHGHRSVLHYLIDKLAYFREGYLFDRYYQQLHRDYPQADVIIFGHTHHQTARWVDGQLLFNPGVAYPCKYNDFKTQYGILSITSEGLIRTEFLGPKNVRRHQNRHFNQQNTL